MKKTSRSVIASLALGLIAVPAAALAQQHQQGQQKEQQRGNQPEGRSQPSRGAHEQKQMEETIPIDQVPEQARNAIQSWAKDSKIDKVEKVTLKDGKTHYKAYIDRDGKKLEVLVAPDGKVLRSGENVGD